MMKKEVKMRKNEYMAPEMEIVEIKSEFLMQQVSEAGGDKGSVLPSRRFSDDDEE